MPTDIIKLLPDSVANQIAAGEVIQRPASVVKELVENAIDAGATSIDIIIKDAGRTLIQVIDNGKGMTPTDARMAFERHATSKITTADDLFTLHTMGFRGEALPSIAAVAQIELRTKTKDEPMGSRLRISESKFEGQEPCSTVQGTNIMVKNLFFHIPARRKFLKKDTVELSHILREFERLALVNPSCDFSIIHNDVTLHKFRGETLKQRIGSLFGRTLSGQLLPVGTETSIVKIEGFIGAPANAKKRNAPQFLFVNGRNMRHPYFHKAILNCYSELISADSQPSYFINFEVAPETIDVNIHPQKHEIKFENEQAIWQILSAAVKQSLGRANAAGALDFDSPDIPDIPVFAPSTKIAMPGIETDTSYNPFSESGIGAPSAPRQGSPAGGTRMSAISDPYRINSRTKDWDKLYESFSSRRDEPIGNTDLPHRRDEMPVNGDACSPESTPRHPALFDEAAHQAFMTIDNRYIALHSQTGLIFIHRRRAHIRVLYERFVERLAGSSLPSQGLIFPETVTLTPAQSAVMTSITDTLGRFGFDVSFLGDNVWAINAVPSLPGSFNAGDVLARLVDDIGEGADVSDQSLIGPAALALARAAAVNHTTDMSAEETDALIAQLFSCSEPSFTPDGLAILHPLDLNEIQHFFN